MQVILNAVFLGFQQDTTFHCSLNPPCLVTIANYEQSQPFDCLPPEFGFQVGANTTIKYALVQVSKCASSPIIIIVIMLFITYSNVEDEVGMCPPPE